jgi:hypothetical protein
MFFCFSTWRTHVNHFGRGLQVTAALLNLAAPLMKHDQLQELVQLCGDCSGRVPSISQPLIPLMRVTVKLIVLILQTELQRCDDVDWIHPSEGSDQRPAAGSCKHGSEPLELLKRSGISWPAEELLTSRGLCPMKNSISLTSIIFSRHATILSFLLCLHVPNCRFTTQVSQQISAFTANLLQS